MEELQNSLSQTPPPATIRTFPAPSQGVVNVPSFLVDSFTMAPRDRDMPFMGGRDQSPNPSRRFRIGADVQPLYETYSSGCDSPSPTPVDLSVSSNRRNTANFSTSLSSIGLAPPPALFAELSSSNDRRRTTSQLPRLDLNYAAPTVARSSLTASASTNDISRPAPRSRGPLFSQLRRVIPRRPVEPVFDMITPPSGLQLTSSVSAKELSQMSLATGHPFGEIRGSKNPQVASTPVGRRSQLSSTTHHSFGEVRGSNTRISSTPAGIQSQMSSTHNSFGEVRGLTSPRVASTPVGLNSQLSSTNHRPLEDLRGSANNFSQISPTTNRPFGEVKGSITTRIPSPSVGLRHGMHGARSNLRSSQTVSDLASCFEEFEEGDEFEGEGLMPSRVKVASRLPSPIFEIPERRYVSTPAMPYQKKENIVPESLQRPISPTRHLPSTSVPKSHTVGNLSKLSNAFSRSNLNLSSNFASTSSLQTAATTPQVTTDNADVVPFYNPNPHLVYEYMPKAFWAGRFSGLNNRYQNEMLNLQVNDPEAYRQTIMASCSPAKAAKLKGKAKKRTKRRGNGPEERPRSTPSPDNETIDILTADENQRAKRVLDDLAAYCMTSMATQSLWDFQLDYARSVRKKSLLPEGGTMPIRIFEKVGRAVESASASLSKGFANDSGKESEE